MGEGSDLSDDDILGIMSYLPFSGLIRARAVCKRWNELAKLTESRVPLSSWCILSCSAKIPSTSRSGSFRDSFRHGLGLSRSGSSRRSSPDCVANFHVVMFDPSIRKWLKVKNEFSSAGPFVSSTRELLWVPSTGGYSGLVCVFEWEEESCCKYNTYWVGNPITGVWKCISGPSPWRGVHHLVVNPNLSYKIISIRWERLVPAGPTGVWRAAIYDSEEGQWRAGAHFSVPHPPNGTTYTLSSRTHTASDKMMYLLMHRAGKLPSWETYTEISIVGYDIEHDSFQFVTPLSRFDHCLEYFEPTACRDWPVHLVLKSDQVIFTNSRQVQTITQSKSSSTPPGLSADPSPDSPAASESPILVMCSTREVPRKKRWYRHKIFQAFANAVKGRPPGFHKEFENKICILEFNEETGSWDATEEKTFKVTGKFYSKDRVFHCAGDRLQHLYCAHLDEHQSVVVYNAKKDDFSTWCPLPPLGAEYGGSIAKNYHSLGSFVPRLDADPYYNTKVSGICKEREVFMLT